MITRLVPALYDEMVRRHLGLCPLDPATARELGDALAVARGKRGSRRWATR